MLSDRRNSRLCRRADTKTQQLRTHFGATNDASRQLTSEDKMQISRMPPVGTLVPASLIIVFINTLPRYIAYIHKSATKSSSSRPKMGNETTAIIKHTPETTQSDIKQCDHARNEPSACVRSGRPNRIRFEFLRLWSNLVVTFSCADNTS